MSACNRIHSSNAHEQQGNTHSALPLITSLPYQKVSSPKLRGFKVFEAVTLNTQRMVAQDEASGTCDFQPPPFVARWAGTGSLSPVVLALAPLYLASCHPSSPTMRALGPCLPLCVAPAADTACSAAAEAAPPHKVHP